MEALIALVAVVLLLIPVLLIVALVMIAGLRRRVAALELQQFDGRPANAADPARADAPEVRSVHWADPPYQARVPIADAAAAVRSCESAGGLLNSHRTLTADACR
jgi:hypothetical protein